MNPDLELLIQLQRVESELKRVETEREAIPRALAEMDATATEGRLVVSGPGGRSGTTLIFMSVAGATPDIIANAILDAARSAAQA